MPIGDVLGNSAKEKLFANSFKIGDVFLAKFDGINHDKFFILFGISYNRLFLCAVYINSDIHPAIRNKQNLLDLQVPLKKSNNPFLKYNSFANCSTTIPMDSEPLGKKIANNSCKVIGSVFQEDLEIIRNCVKNSGLLSEDDIELYF